MAYVPLCNPADLERILGPLGLEARADDDGDNGEEGRNVEYAIREASRDVLLALSPLFGGSDAAIAVYANNWLLQTLCAARAACYLCRRRGNPIPDSVAGLDCQEVQETLNRIRASKDHNVVPGLADELVAAGGPPLGPASNVPGFANLNVDARFGGAKLRTDQANSTGVVRNLRRDGDWNWWRGAWG